MKMRLNGILGGGLSALLCLSAVAQTVAPVKSSQKASPAKVSAPQRIDLANNAPRVQNLFTNLDRISSRSYQLKPDQTVRVLLDEGISSAKIKHTGTVYVYALDGDMRRYKFNQPGVLSAKIKKGKVHVGWISSAKAVVIDPQDGVSLTFKRRVYNGMLVLIPREGTMRVVEHVNLEDYLLGVVGYEMSPSWPLESLKAQAVAARTFARIKMQDKSAHYDLRNTPADQIYTGVADIADSVKQAVSQTHGQVLMYNNKLLPAFFHASCGGHTLNGKVLMGRKAPPPLRGVSCPSHAKVSGHRVGMCQEGAKVLAQRKHTYRAILNHYFPGAELKTL